MLSVLDSDKRLADHFGGKVSLPLFPRLKADPQLHLGYQELRKILADIAENRMQQRNNRPPPQVQPFQPPLNAPSGPSAPTGPTQNFQNNSGYAPSPPVPRTPNHGLVPPADELPAVGHGDKVKREAGELVEDVKESRYESRREDRYRDHVRDSGDKYDSGGRRRDRYEDEPRRERRYE
jgi:RNA-binding protein Luc7-like 2